jgi:outer membrane protein assembly factor BamB
MTELSLSPSLSLSSARSAFGRSLRPLGQALLVTGLVGFLSACGSDDWFGGPEDPPLPGNRISVLEHQQRLQPAAGASTVDLRLPAPEANSDWPQAGGYSHHAMQHMELGPRPQKLWSRSVGAGTDSRNRLMGEPVVADGKIFVVDVQASVTALDAETGKTLWNVDLAPDYDEDESILGGGVAYDKGTLVVTTGFAQVVALDAKTGKERWRTPVTAPMRAAPTINGGRVFVVTVDNKGIALALSDGRLLWTHAGVEEVTSLLVGAAPAVDNGVVIMPYTSGEIAALRVDNGVPLWTDSIVAARRTDASANLADIGARPVIDGNRVFVVGHSGLLVALDMRSGNRAWEVEMSGLSQPWVAGGYLYVLTADSQLVALDSVNGRVLWVRQLAAWTDLEDQTGRIVWAGPTLASDRLIVTGSHGVLLSISPYDGTVLGREDLSSGVTLPPAVANKTLYFLTDDADIVAFR